MADLEKVKTVASKDNLEALGTIIKRRRQLASFLHDPLPYSFEGGSVAEICEIAEREMWITKLLDMTMRKFNVLDSLYQDNRDYYRSNRIGEIQERFRAQFEEMDEQTLGHSEEFNDESTE